MAKHEEYEKRTEELLLPILEAEKLSLVDVEYVKEAGTWYLRAYIDKDGGVTIDDCENVSRALSEKMDQSDFIPDAYILEVSSPGLGRPLKKDKDYTRNMGKEIELRTYKKENEGQEFMGTLKSFDKETLTLETEGRTLVFQRKNLSMIREYVDWNE